jgi:hypothetical protein
MLFAFLQQVKESYDPDQDKSHVSTFARNYIYPPHLYRWLVVWVVLELVNAHCQKPTSPLEVANEPLTNTNENYKNKMNRRGTTIITKQERAHTFATCLFIHALQG